MKGTPGIWKVETENGYPVIKAFGLGRFQDGNRTIAILKDNSILSYEDAELIVEAVNMKRVEMANG